MDIGHDLYVCAEGQLDKREKRNYLVPQCECDFFALVLRVGIRIVKLQVMELSSGYYRNLRTDTAEAEIPAHYQIKGLCIK